MSRTLDASRIRKAIRSYAKSYGALQVLQEQSGLIPHGDQKTGCIGEFYAYLHLRRLHPDATLTFGGPSTKGWDIRVRTRNKVFLVQIKTVSAYSETRTISPIHRGWDTLYVIYLARSFEPAGFWVIADKNIAWKTGVIKGCKCPLPGNPHSASPGIPFGKNRLAELIATVRATDKRATSDAAPRIRRPRR